MRRRLPVVLAAALAVGSLAAGCGPSSGTHEPAPSQSVVVTEPPHDLPAADTVVDALAEGLSELDVSDVPMQGSAVDAQAELETIFAGMDGLHPRVVADKIEYRAGEEAATAHLSFAYDIGLKGWKYETTAPLELVDGKWVVAWTPTIAHSMLTSDSRLRHQRKLPKRAAINDNAGLALVEERTLYQVGIDKAQVAEDEWEQAAADLAAMLEIDAEAYQAKVLSGGPKQFVVAKTMRQEDISPDVGQVLGAQVVETTAMVAPSDTFAVSLLGKTGLPSAEQVAESKGDVWPQDTVGLSGLQARYEKRLRGVPEVRVDLVGRSTPEDPNAGKDFEEQSLFLQEPSVGDPLELSLDRELQTKAEAILAKQPGVASLVVIHPSDGALLVAANSPAAGVYPQATFGKFAPGSTFKVVSALAMLRKGMTPSSAVSCPASLSVAGHTFGNYSDYPSSMIGSITLQQALAHSCNTAFAGAAKAVTPEELHTAAGSLGVGTDYDAGFASNFGTVEPNNTEIDRAASMIGQGQITVSPLAMANVAASVAGGRTVIPWLVKGEEAASTAPPLTADEAAQLQQMMQAVVTEGSGKSLAGLFTGAKTGTAEWGPVGQYQTHGWMIAWNANYAVAAFVEVGESGSKSAGPMITELFTS